MNNPKLKYNRIKYIKYLKNLFQSINACLTNFANEYTNLSLSYVFLDTIGEAIGQVSLPTITGRLVSKDPIWFAWIIFRYNKENPFFSKKTNSSFF